MISFLINRYSCFSNFTVYAGISFDMRHIKKVNVFSNGLPHIVHKSNEAQTP